MLRIRALCRILRDRYNRDRRLGKCVQLNLRPVLEQYDGNQDVKRRGEHALKQIDDPGRRHQDAVLDQKQRIGQKRPGRKDKIPHHNVHGDLSAAPAGGRGRAHNGKGADQPDVIDQHQDRDGQHDKHHRQDDGRLLPADAQQHECAKERNDLYQKQKAHAD